MDENTEIVQQFSGARPVFSPSVNKLIGSYDKKLDTKSRLSLPAPYKEKLEGEPLIMVRWLKRSLAIFPECNWMPFAESIGGLDLYTEIGLTVRHQMFAHAREVSMDKEGRIVIPPDMVEYARIDRKVMLLGDWDKITIWNYIYYQDQVAIDDVMVTERFPAVLQLAKGQKSLEDFEAEFTAKPKQTNEH